MVLRIASIAFLMLLLLVPLVMIGGIVANRQQLQRQVEDTVASSFAGPQRMVGPLLVIPYVEREIAISTDESGRQHKRTIEHQRQVLFVLNSCPTMAQRRLMRSTKGFTRRSYIRPRESGMRNLRCPPIWDSISIRRALPSAPPCFRLGLAM